MNKHSFKRIKKRLVFRVLPFILAFLMLLTSAPVAVFSTDEKTGESAAAGDVIYDYDTLKITLHGEDISSMSIYPYEKIEISGTGVPENATYQWQIKHPEKNNLWVNIYDAKSDTIGVSAALINNMLTEDGTAALRLRAYTDDYAYLSNPVTVTLLEEAQPDQTLSVENITFPHAMAGDTSETPEFVTVTINYVKWEYHYDSVNDTYVLTQMGDAFSPYKATLVYNGSLSTTVTNPTIIGYEPYFENSATSTDKVELDLTNITENVVYTVNYKPAKVKYEVNYYFQNIYDDLYAENLTLAPHFTGEGYTGMPPYYKTDGSGNIIKDTETKEGVYAEFEGFTALYYQPDTIAADGSTVFEVYYERNYYLMEFDCTGGYGVHTLYVRHGTYISVPTPTRPGYVFAGWDLVDAEGNGDGVADTIPDEMPIGNTAYKALWTTAQTTYTVVYWRENADDNGYSYWGSAQQEAMSASEVSGTSFTTAPNELPERSYFTYNSAKTIAEENARTDLVGGKVIVEGDGSTVVNTYFSRNVYTVQFTVNANFTAPAASHTHGDGNCSCNYSHVHGPECVSTLVCTIPEHTAHTASCIDCEITEHTHGVSCSLCNQEGHVHTTACCKLDEHKHGTACYSLSSGSWGNAYNGTPDGTPASNGIVRTGNNYYYKIGDIWYQIMGLSNDTWRSNYYRNVTFTKNQSCIDGHTHGDGNCDYSDCSLHVHTEDCYKCNQLAHIHSADCCTTAVHTTHTTSCYAGVGERTDYGDYLLDNPTEGQVYKPNWSNYRFIYIQGQWYNYTGSTNSGNVAPTTCHTHGDGNCTYCSTAEHTHSDACMDCGLTEHTHNDSCYKDEIHTHTDSCYEWSCGEITHVHSPECCTKPVSYVSGTTYVIEAKYNQTIGDIWPTSANYPGLYGWTIEGNTNTTAVSKKVNMTTDLCDTSDGVRTATANTTSTSYTVHLYYMFESFDQTSAADGKDRKRYPDNSSGIYYDKSELYYQDVQAASYTFSQKNIAGMTAVGVDSVKIADGEYDNFLYYTRNSNTFKYFNYNEELTENANNNIQIKFEKPLSYLQISKEDMEELYYPGTLEPNAYEFDGWYTTPKCFPGTEVNWDTLIMPDAPLTVYAKWTPVVRNVTFHLLYTDIDKGVYWYPSELTDAQKPGYYPLKVPHGQLLGTTYSHIPTRGSDYQFIGWFYFDENGKKKFAPDSMKITRDLVLFAEWLSTIPTTYEVNYEAWDDKTEKKIEDIADKLEGYSTAGKTTTFNAKGGTALYDKVPPNSTSTTYQEQWFPEHSSHSILMDEDSSKNTHTFKYYYKEYINYKVIHIDRATGTILHESEVKRTSNAIVTEKFMPFQDYLPESYYIEKAIAYDDTDYTQYPDHVEPENIIYFYYNEDTGHDPFRVEHYYQELDGTTWTLKFSENGIADNGATISRDSRNDTGFEFSYYTITTYTQNGSEWEKNIVEGKSLPATGTVSVHGMEIKFYYTRKLVDYTVKYVEYGSNPEKVLYTETFEGQKKFGEEVSVTAVTDFKDGEQTYIHVEGIDSSAEDRTLTKEMRENAEDNVFVFYYNLKTFDIFYHIVCSAPGSAGLNGVSVSKQTVSVLNDSVRSTALVGTGFKFVGWFYDADCTNPVTDSAWLADDGKTIIPQGISDEAHYYAKFEPISGNLTITKDVENPDTETKDDNFLFHVKGQNTRNEYIDVIVSVTGENSVTLKDLPIGDYVVTELADWSWEYSIIDANKTQNVVIIQDATTLVTFTNKDNNPNWLNGEAVNENQFN